MSSADRTRILLSYPEQLATAAGQKHHAFAMRSQEEITLWCLLFRGKRERLSAFNFQSLMKPFLTSCEGWVGRWKMTPSSFG